MAIYPHDMMVMSDSARQYHYAPTQRIKTPLYPIVLHTQRGLLPRLVFLADLDEASVDFCKMLDRQLHQACLRISDPQASVLRVAQVIQQCLPLVAQWRYALTTVSVPQRQAGWQRVTRLTRIGEGHLGRNLLLGQRVYVACDHWVCQVTSASHSPQSLRAWVAEGASRKTSAWMGSAWRQPPDRTLQWILLSEAQPNRLGADRLLHTLHLS